MTYVVTIPAVHASFAVVEAPDEAGLPPLEARAGWRVEPGARVEVVPDLADWPDGTEGPSPTLCRSATDPNHYKLFRRPEDAPPGEFEATELGFGGTYSRRAWDRFVRDVLPKLLRFYEIPDADADADADAATDEAMHLTRAGR